MNRVLAAFFCVLLCCAGFAQSRPAVSGTIVADTVRLSSRCGGRVDRISAHEGDTVRAGQTVVELEAPELSARRDYAAAILSELERGARPEEIEAARREKEAVSAELETARSDRKRAQDLFKAHQATASERDRAVSHVTALEKSLAAAGKRLDLLTLGATQERLAQARAQLAEIDAQLSETLIRAPIDAVIDVLNVEVGETVAPYRDVATLLIPKRLWTRVYVPETWLSGIKVGDEVRVMVDSLPSKEFKGTVEQINRNAEFTPRNVQTAEDRIRQTFGVKVRLKDPDDKLRGGMSAEVTFPGTSTP